MKLKRLIEQDGSPVGWVHYCPGCGGAHAIWVEQPNRNGAKWTFDGNVNAPTFGPSILCYTEAAVTKVRTTLCHYFLIAGELQYCGDSPHKFSGMKVPLPDLPPYYAGGLDVPDEDDKKNGQNDHSEEAAAPPKPVKATVNDAITAAQAAHARIDDHDARIAALETRVKQLAGV